MLDALVEHGFVERSRTSRDRRIITCSLTGEGRSLIAGRRAMVEQSWQEALTDIPTDQLELSAAVFERIAAMFDEFDADAHA